MNSISNPIPVTEEADWQQLLSHTIDDPAELLKLLDLPSSLLNGAQQGSDLFSLKVPKPFLQRIEKGNPNDPLLRQILPLDAESADIPGYVTDPLAEMAANHSDGLIHKYHGPCIAYSQWSLRSKLSLLLPPPFPLSRQPLRF